MNERMDGCMLHWNQRNDKKKKKKREKRETFKLIDGQTASKSACNEAFTMNLNMISTVYHLDYVEFKPTMLAISYRSRFISIFR